MLNVKIYRFYRGKAANIFNTDEIEVEIIKRLPRSTGREDILCLLGGSAAPSTRVL